MKKLALGFLGLALLVSAIVFSGCAPVERRVARYVISNYIGVWEKEGATPDDRSADSSQCVLKSLDAEGVMMELPYRDCMTAKGWTLTPYWIE